MEALAAAPSPSTVLDLDAVRAVRAQDTLVEAVPARLGLFARYREALRSRIDLLVECGLLIRAAAPDAQNRTRQLAVAADAEERIEMAMKQRERRPASFAEAEELGGKVLRIGVMEAGRTYRGRVVTMAEDSAGQVLVVLDTGRYLTAIPAPERDFTPGREVRARAAAAAAEGDSTRRGVLAWQLEELEQARKLGHDRDR